MLFRPKSNQIESNHLKSICQFFIQSNLKKRRSTRNDFFKNKPKKIKFQSKSTLLHSNHLKLHILILSHEKISLVERIDFNKDHIKKHLDYHLRQELSLNYLTYF
jgi:hypothetical protein